MQSVEVILLTSMKQKKEIKCKNNRNAGFTLAELLIAIGILSILFSVGMIAVVHYKKSLKLIEMDATAREIFVATQNHMTAAKASGTWKSMKKEHIDNADGYFGSPMIEKPSDYPTNESWPQNGVNGSEHEYYYIVYNGEKDSLSNTILNTILPLGSIDEEVRNDGFYVIEYDLSTATVYGVFYTDDLNKCNYENDIMGANGLDKANGREDSSHGKETRKNYKNNHGNVIIGYYGGATSQNLTTTLLEPLELQVDNSDVLQVRITDTNYFKKVNGQEIKSKITVTVTGEESQASVRKTFDFSELVAKSYSTNDEWWSVKKEKEKLIYTLTLDDITRQGGHFADIFPELIPGENIIIVAEVFSNNVLCKAVKSNAYTNSLFEANYEYEENGKIASKVTIGNVRHLQNLSPEVSNLPIDIPAINNNQNISKIIDKAEQLTVLDWDSFMPNGKSENRVIYSYDRNLALQKELSIDQFYGITNLAIVEYEGNRQQLKNFNIKENENGNVGLFSQIGSDTTPQNLTIKNLNINNFISQSSKNGGNAGILVGKVNENGYFIGKNILVTNSTVKTAGQGNAGGIAGEIGNGYLEHCGVYLTDDNGGTAAQKYELGAYNQKKKQVGSKFIILSDSGVAGGLVGKTKNTTITDCFASVPVASSNNGVSGGLIGLIEGGTNQETVIKNSYVGGYTKNGQYSEFFGSAAMGNKAIAGGFIGKDAANQTEILNCFSTVSSYANTTGGFIGKIEAKSHTYTNCYATGKVEGISGESIRGSFIGMAESSASLIINRCYSLKDSNVDLKQNISSVIDLDYEEFTNFVNQEEVSKVSTTNKRNASTRIDVENYCYDKTLETLNYPFRLVNSTAAKNESSKKVYYGDWPIKVETNSEFDYGIIYYEKLLEDDTFYYHGWGSKSSENPDDESNYVELKTQKEGLSNGLELGKDNYVEEDGYLFLLPNNVDLESWEIKIVENYNEIKDILKKKDITLPVELQEFSAYELKDNVINNWYFSGQKPKISFVKSIPINPWQDEKKTMGYFSFTPHFADSVQPMEVGIHERTFYIRSTRQLVNLQKNTSFTNWGKQENYFIQKLDISFTKVSTYPCSNTIEDFYAGGYESLQYPDKSGTYKIQGLNVTMFGNTASYTILKGITLTDIQIHSLEGDKSVAGLVRTNGGTIESCTIHSSENTSTGYDNVVIEGNGVAAGFVETNRGIIRNSYFTGIVKGNHVSGFVNTNEGTITNSYANSISTGIIEASGFISLNNGGKLLNCYSIGSIISTGDNSVSYGFIGLDNNGTIKDCYSALFKLSGSQIYRFGRGRGVNTFINCHWLNNGYTEGEVQMGDVNNLKEQGKAITYEELSQTGTNSKTFKYNSSYEKIDKIKTVYPFELLSSEDAYVPIEFWGDWPMEDLSFNAGFIYYEIVDGKMYYYGLLTKYNKADETPNYQVVMTPGDENPNGLLDESDTYQEVISPGLGNTNGLQYENENYQEVMTPDHENTNGLFVESDEYETEEGYMVLIPKGTEISTLAISFGDSYIEKLVNVTEKVEERVLSQLTGIEGFHAYYLKLEKLPKDFFETEIIDLQFGGYQIQDNQIVLEDYTAKFTFQPVSFNKFEGEDE